MPPVSVTIGALIGAGLGAAGIITSTAILGSAIITGAVVYGAISGLTYAIAYLTRPGLPDIGTGSGSTRRTIRASVNPARWVLGRARIGGHLIYAGAFDIDVNNVPYTNYFYPRDDGIYYYNNDRQNGMIVFLALCNGPIDAIEKIWVGGKEFPITELDAGGIASQTDDDEKNRLFSDMTIAEINQRNNMSMYADLTGNGQRDYVPWLNAYPTTVDNADFTGQNGTSNPQPDNFLNGIAYVVIRLQQPNYGRDLDRRAFTGIPHIEFQVRGLKVPPINSVKYDYSSFTEKYRYATWSENPATLRYWWLRERRGLPRSAIDIPSAFAAERVCERNIDQSDSTAPAPNHIGKIYTMNGIIISTDSPEGVEQEMDFAWQGFSIEIGGKYYFRPGVNRPVSARINENHIISLVSIQPQQGLQDRFNSISVKIAQSIEHDYLEHSIADINDNAQIARDGRFLPKDFGTRTFITDPIRMKRVVQTILQRAKSSVVYTYNIAPGDNFENLSIKPTDRITITDSLHGLNNKSVQVESVRLNPDWSLVIIAQETPGNLFPA